MQQTPRWADLLQLTPISREWGGGGGGTSGAPYTYQLYRKEIKQKPSACHQDAVFSSLASASPPPPPTPEVPSPWVLLRGRCAPAGCRRGHLVVRVGPVYLVYIKNPGLAAQQKAASPTGNLVSESEGGFTHWDYLPQFPLWCHISLV